MTRGERGRALVAGLAAGAFGGLFGVGGGIIMIPLLTGWFGATQHQAHGTSLAVVGVTALAALAVYAGHRNVDWPAALVVGVAAALAARLGARLAARVSARHLKRAFAVLLLLVGARLLWIPQPVGVAIVGGIWAIVADLVLGTAVGLLAGFMGVGGGVIAVPGFALLYGLPQHVAQGTSLAVILIAAPIATLENLRLGNVLTRLLPMLAVGAAAGGILASLVVQSLPREALTRAFGVFLIANAPIVWLRANPGPGPAAGSPRA